MQYNSFRYIYPPRPETKINPASLSNYGEYLAQVKYNGSCTIVYLHPDHEPLIYNRHNELVSRDKFPKCDIDWQGIHSGTGWMVVVGELMNKAAAGEDGDNLKGFILFDVLVYNSKYLVGSTLQERLDLLENLFPTQRIQVTPEGAIEYRHLGFTNLAGVYKAPVYQGYLSALWKDVVQVPAYEGLVLKKENARLDFGFNPKNNFQWSVKCRKPTKNYTF